MPSNEAAAPDATAPVPVALVATLDARGPIDALVPLDAEGVL
jgi:hypothetical protein